jgi:outer membrane receptor for ferrienterochelin and colicin
LLAQVTAFRELKDYNTEVAENLTARNLQRNGVNASTMEVRSWDKINNAALQGRLDISTEVVIAEEKVAIAAGTTVNHVAQNVRGRGSG